MNVKVQMKINGRWVLIEEAPPDCRDFEPEEEPKRRRPLTYKVYAIRRPGSVDERAAEAVLDWLSGCSSG